MTADNAGSVKPCLLMWGECPQGADSHVCHRQEEHSGRCRCGQCGATTTVIDPIFEDPEELQAAREVLGE